MLAQLLVRAFENWNQGAGLELLGDRGDIVQALRLAEHAHEAIALRARAAEQAPFGEDDGPRAQAEDEQDDEDSFGDQTAGFNQT